LEDLDALKLVVIVTEATICPSSGIKYHVIVVKLDVEVVIGCGEQEYLWPIISKDRRRKAVEHSLIKVLDAGVFVSITSNSL
jgi:hypothetical protein